METLIKKTVWVYRVQISMEGTSLIDIRSTLKLGLFSVTAVHAQFIKRITDFKHDWFLYKKF